MSECELLTAVGRPSTECHGWRSAQNRHDFCVVTLRLCHTAVDRGQRG
jgi:hypothetical protein